MSILEVFTTHERLVAPMKAKFGDDSSTRRLIGLSLSSKFIGAGIRLSWDLEALKLQIFTKYDNASRGRIRCAILRNFLDL